MAELFPTLPADADSVLVIEAGHEFGRIGVTSRLHGRAPTNVSHGRVEAVCNAAKGARAGQSGVPGRHLLVVNVPLPQSVAQLRHGVARAGLIAAIRVHALCAPITFPRVAMTTCLRFDVGARNRQFGDVVGRGFY